MHLVAETANNDDSNLFEALVKEYELTFNALEQSVGRNVQLTIAIVTTLGVALSAIPQIRLHQHYTVVLVLPAFFVVLFGILLFELATSHAHIWSCRVLARRINTLLPDTALLRFEPSFPTATAFSVTRGLRKVQILQAIMLVGPFLLLFGLLAVLASGLYDCAVNPVAPSQNDPGGACPRQAWWLLLLWVPVVIVEMSLALGPMNEIPARFRAFFGDDPELTSFPARTRVIRPARPVARRAGGLRARARSAFFWVMPRPWDFVCKWPVFWTGFMTIWISQGISTSQIERVNAFVGPLFGGRGWTESTVPALAVVTLALLYFLVEEVGFQQAKFLIDDAQPGDVKRDQMLLQNRGWRAVSAGVISPDTALAYGVYRGAASLAFAYVLGGPLFLATLVLSAFHQAVYVFLLKPVARAVPVLVLFWISLNLVPRLLSGYVAASDQPFTTWVPIMVLATFVVSSLGGMAAQWKMEAQHHGPEVRGQSAYLLKYGDRWQTLGFAAAIAVPFMAGLVYLVANTSIGFALLQCPESPLCRPIRGESLTAGVFQPDVLLAPAGLIVSAAAVVLAVIAARPDERSRSMPSEPTEPTVRPSIPAWVVAALTLAVIGIVARLGSTATGTEFAAWFGLLLLAPTLALVLPRRPRTKTAASKPGGLKPVALAILLVLGLALWTAAALLNNLGLWLAMLTVMQAWLFVHFRGMKYTEFAVGGMAKKADASEPRL
jgi:hypothetical protein